MKIYEIGTPSHYDDNDGDCDCTIWVALEDGLTMIQTDQYGINGCMYMKEIPEYDENTPGVDFIIRKEK
jgi:hypothetical protein